MAKTADNTIKLRTVEAAQKLADGHLPIGFVDTGNGHLTTVGPVVYGIGRVHDLDKEGSWEEWRFESIPPVPVAVAIETPREITVR